MTPAARVLAALTELGEDERAILADIAERLVLGRRTYGELDLATDRRDFRGEALEEALDLAVYLAAAIRMR